MTKKKRIILIIIGVLICLGIAVFFYWDNVHCKSIKRRCTMYDLSEIENVEDLEFYRSLNEKCAGKCGMSEIKLKWEKWLCRYQYKKHVEKSKDRRYFQADTYNPCPELYTLPELNGGGEKSNRILQIPFGFTVFPFIKVKNKKTDHFWSVFFMYEGLFILHNS